METIYADQIVKSNHQHPGIPRAADRIPNLKRVCVYGLTAEFVRGFFLVLGVEKVSKDRISPCEQTDPCIKPT